MKIGVYFRETEERSGGGFTFESSLVETLLSQDLARDHRFIFIGPEGSLMERIRDSGQETQGIPTDLRGRAALKSRSQIRRLASKNRRQGSLEWLVKASGVDVLWCLGPDVPTMEVPFWITIWDLQHRKQPWFPEVSGGGTWARREGYYSEALKRATRVVVSNEAGKADVQLFYQVPDERIICAPHPVPQWVYQDQQVETTERVPFEEFLLYPAQFWPHKNHGVLLEALSLLRQRGLDIGLVLVGSDAGNRPHVESLIDAMGLTPYVHLEGFVTRPRLASLYRSATAVTYVSLFGPENLPPLESFAFGTPVIAGEVEGAREQFGDAALLVDATDAVAIASAVERVRKDVSLRQRLVDDGYQLINERTPQMFITTVMDSIESFATTARLWSRE